MGLIRKFMDLANVVKDTTREKEIHVNSLIMVADCLDEHGNGKGML